MIRVLIADSRPDRREQICAALASGVGIEVAGQAQDGGEALQKAHALTPEVALVAADLAGPDAFAVAEHLAALHPPIEVIILSGSAAPGDLRRAMRAGAREHLAWPCPAPDLCDAVRSICEESRRRRSPADVLNHAPSGAKIIAVTGAKGGIGKTTLAVNLAATLAVETGQPTALLDLYTQFGDAALLLNLAPRRTLADLVRVDPADLDERLLEDHLERHECGLRVLAGAASPLPLDALTPARLDCLLQLLRRGYRTIVVDVPPLLHATTLHALAQADTALLIANLFDLTTLAGSRLWLEAVAGQSIRTEAVQVVLNRVSPSNRLQIPDIERTLGRPVSACIPNDGKLVPGSVNSGVPFTLSHPGSRVAQSVLALARQLAAHGTQTAAETPPRRAAFLAPLLRRGG